MLKSLSVLWRILFPLIKLCMSIGVFGIFPPGVVKKYSLFIQFMEALHVKTASPINLLEWVHMCWISSSWWAWLCKTMQNFAKSSTGTDTLSCAYPRAVHLMLAHFDIIFGVWFWGWIVFKKLSFIFFCVK